MAICDESETSPSSPITPNTTLSLDEESGPYSPFAVNISGGGSGKKKLDSVRSHPLGFDSSPEKKGNIRGAYKVSSGGQQKM